MAGNANTKLIIGLVFGELIGLSSLYSFVSFHQQSTAAAVAPKQFPCLDIFNRTELVSWVLLGFY